MTEPASNSALPGVADSQIGLSDPELADLTRHYWMKAGELTEPERIEPDARAAINEAIEFARGQRAIHISAMRAWSKVTTIRLRGKKRDPFTNRLHRAMGLMAQRLFETSVYDAGRRCATECLGPAPSDPPGWHCSAINDPARATCARSLVFPYLHPDGAQRDRRNFAKAAKAIHRGLALEPVRQENGQPYTLTVEAVRKAIVRFAAA